MNITREGWLINASNALRPLFQAAGAPLPVDLPQLSIGFPSRGALSGKVVGQCFNAKKASHVFITPLHTTAFDVFDTLTHELVHVVTPGAKHGGKFVKVCKAIGLTKNKPTSAEAGPELVEKLKTIMKELGALPHIALDPSLEKQKVQGTRMLKAQCSACAFTVRLTQKWLDVANPICPDPACKRHGRTMRVEAK